MKKSDFKKGQEVFLYIADFADELRHMKNPATIDRTETGIVTSVGTKYITVINKKNWEYKFEIDNDFLEHINIGNRTYELFLREEDIYKYVSAQKDYEFIKNYFNSYKYTRNHKLSSGCIKVIKDVILEDLVNECD